MRAAFTLLLCAGILAGAVPLAALAAAGRDPEPPSPRTRFRWPLEGPHRVARPFEPPSSAYGPGHRGTDLRGAAGSPVLAPADGLVVHAGPLAGRGVVSLVHAGGLRTTYEPVAVAVSVGDRVRAGERIGALDPGHPGCPPGSGRPGAEAPGACLHWGARRGDYLDPLALLGGHRVRLLPWNSPPSTTANSPTADGEPQVRRAIVYRISAAR